MKGKVLTAMMLALVFVFSACKKEDVSPEDDSALKMEGQWQIESINFLDNVIEWDEDVEYNISNYFGYAPAMFELMWGLDFKSNKIAGGKGYKLLYINGGDFNTNPADDNWYWNYKGENAFEIQQTNLDMPPYDFSIKKVKELTQSDNGKTLVFKAEIATRRSGKAMTDAVKVPVEITLIKKTPTKGAEILLFGAPFHAGDLGI